MKKSIFELQLHETINLPKTPLTENLADFTKVTRVPGGWIYTEFNQEIGQNETSIATSSVFVPYNDEFKPNNTERF
jgi:hypothetical protein